MGQGFAGMKVGGTRALTIPPQWVTARARGVIPPNATLLFVLNFEVK
jgi:FKBP-type peptidyl-prolyl cis-trans isomerase FkpA